MDPATLYAAYSVARELSQISRKLKNQIEQKAKAADDLDFHLKLRMAEDIRNLKASTISAAIISAQLANPELPEQEIMQRFLECSKVADNVIDALRRANP